tara:strand:+ start:2144 stop:3250 length:1107 start_codon:yes stop_codon:yes gene_type:complete
MKIEQVSWRGFGIPFNNPYSTAHGSAIVRYGMLIFLRASDGTTGVGEASPIGPGSLSEITSAGRYLEKFSANLLNQQLPFSSVDLANNSEIPSTIRFGVETAVADLFGKLLGRNISQDTISKMPALPVNALIASASAKQAAYEANLAFEAGFETIKLKVGQGTIKQDEALLSGVRDAIPSDVKIRIDANQTWNINESIRRLNKLSSYNIEYVEDPVTPTCLEDMHKLKQSVSVPIAVDEALANRSIESILKVAENADIIVIKAGRLGGIQPSLKLMQLAQDLGKGVVVTSSLESGVGVTTSAHLCANLSEHTFAHGLGTTPLLESDLLSASASPSQGNFIIPTGPGLGISIDGGLLDKFSLGPQGNVT